MTVTRRLAAAMLAPLVTLALAHAALASGRQDPEEQEPEEKAIELRVRPRTTQSPGTIRVVALIARDAANRDVTIEAESAAFFRSSTEAIDGEAGPTRFVRVFDGLPPGTYEISARVERNDGTELLDVVTVEVFGPKGAGTNL